MPNFTGWVEITGSQSFDVYVSTDKIPHPVGTVAQTRDGCRYVFVQAGAVALVPGNSIQGPATEPLHLALTPSAAAIGDTSIVATLGAAAAAENRYADGYVGIDTTPGNGYRYEVDSHLAVLSGGVITARLRKDSSIQVALTTSSRVGFMANPHKGVIQTPVTTATGLVVGVAVSAIAISGYGWIQQRGPVSALINGTPALGAMMLAVSGTTAGSFDIATAAPLIVSQICGRMMQIGVSGKNNWMWLGLD